MGDHNDGHVTKHSNMEDEESNMADMDSNIVQIENTETNESSTDDMDKSEGGFEDNFVPSVNASPGDGGTLQSEFKIPNSESEPSFNTLSSTPRKNSVQNVITPDLDSGFMSSLPSSEDVPNHDPKNDAILDDVLKRRKVALSRKVEDIGKNLNWSSPERPSTLKLDNFRDLSVEETENIERLSNMSPSYYCLTPSDNSLDDLDDLDTPASPDSMNEVFDKILGPKFSNSSDLMEKNMNIVKPGRPFTINVQTPEVVALPVEAHVIERNNDTHRRLIPVENGITTFGSIENQPTESGPARLEVTDHPLASGDHSNSSTFLSNSIQATAFPSDVSYHDVQLSVEDNKPSVAYRSTSSLQYYHSDIVPLDEVYTRDFIPEELRNGQHVASVYPRECHGWTGANLSPESMPVQLIQLKVTEQDYSSALKWLSRDVKISCHTVLYNKWLQVSLFSIIFITLWMLGFLLWHTGGLPDRIGIGLFFILAWVLMVIGLIICRVIRNKLNKRTENTLSAVNDVLSRYNVIMGIEDKGAMACNRIILHFLYFEEGPCLERVLDNLNKGLQKKRKMTNPEKIKSDQGGPEIDIDESDLIMKRDMTDGQRQELAKRLMLKYSSLYVKRLMMERMPRPTEPRHAGNLPCLCQFVDRHYFKMYDVMAMV